MNAIYNFNFLTLKVLIINTRLYNQKIMILDILLQNSKNIYHRNLKQLTHLNFHFLYTMKRSKYLELRTI